MNWWTKTTISGELSEVRRAAWSYVALALDKMYNRNSFMTRWMDRTSVVVGTFDSHDFGMKWSYAEMAVAIEGLGARNGRLWT